MLYGFLYNIFINYKFNNKGFEVKMSLSLQKIPTTTNGFNGACSNKILTLV